ncbi:Gfo/Idh/MocA family protein [Nibricoccus sp. IMCC34717]|uniref:Gfo/Idh/MocA family protein n=1 Tax=Nibricoccus sp. IMCC34717 TaxID=3034021 RepID=UPI00384C94E6
MAGIAVIGYGYWGPKLVRNFLQRPFFQPVAIVEENQERLRKGLAENPAAQFRGSFEEVLRDPHIHAVAIATPVATHFPLAKAALLAGKHVLVEKPLANSSADAEELVALATERGLTLAVDHTYVYHPAVERVRQVVQGGELGTLSYIDSSRINLGLFQHDVNVLWDLAVHDIAIINTLTPERPTSVQAIGVAHFAQNIENMGILILRYASGLFVHVNCSWVSPVKLRHMLIGGTRKMIIYDDLNFNEPVKIYDSGVTARNHDERNRLMYEYRAGDVFSPRIPHQEALANLVTDFEESLTSGRPPRSDGRFAADTVRILEAAQQSVKQHGQEITLDWPRRA